MKTLKLSRSDVTRGALILVNPSHPLQEDRKENELLPLRSVATPILLERQAAKMLAKVMSFLDCGEQITLVSGYRNRREQQTIYEDTLREQGEDFTNKYVAIPGCSEHQTGLAIDLAENKNDIDLICPDFPYTGVCGQFRELAAQYGFIERYPAERESITHIAHEPWHFRYVGYPHSEIMKEKMLTLEEYTDYLKQFPYHDTHFTFTQKGHCFEIFYVLILPDMVSVIEIPDATPYQISGNNDGGVLVTLWRA